MSGAVERVWLVQTPSVVADAWRVALHQACLERGWDFKIHERGDETPTASPNRSLLVVAWLDQAQDLTVTHWAVQLSDPVEVAALLKAQSNLSDHDTYYEASLRLATAWRLVERGASVHWSDAETLEIAGLGRVNGPPQATRATISRSDGPLSVFTRDQAVKAGVTSWTPEIFLYPETRQDNGPSGSFPLVGRRRLLLNGPNIFLPPGNWAFQAEISIDPPGRTEILVEWGHGHDVASLVAPISMAGRYELSLEKEWTDVQPADFRISLMIPALEGSFVFHGGTLARRTGEGPGEVKPEQTSAPHDH